MKSIKKFKEKEEEAKEGPKSRKTEKPERLYDADMDDLDSDDIGESEKSRLKSKNPQPEMVSNISAMRQAVYQLGFMITLLFFCSCTFAFLTRQELIFPERSAPKYIFDMVQAAFFMVFVTIWV